MNDSDHSQALEQLFAELDARHWDGRLHQAGWRCGMAPMRERKYGHALRDDRLIEIAERLLGDPAELRRTLLHEMIHAWLYVTRDPSHQCRNESHGAAFAAEIARLREAAEDLATEEEYVVCGDTAEARLQEAAECYLARQSRRQHPDGRFDSADRWHPSDRERQTCCDHVRGASRRWPYAHLAHCRTVTHLSRLYSVDTVALRRALAHAKLQRS